MAAEESEEDKKSNKHAFYLLRGHRRRSGYVKKRFRGILVRNIDTDLAGRSNRGHVRPPAVRRACAITRQARVRFSCTSTTLATLPELSLSFFNSSMSLVKARHIYAVRSSRL